MTCEVPDWVDRSNPLSAFDDTSTSRYSKKASTYLHHQQQWQHPHLQQHHRSVLHTSSVSALVPIAGNDMVKSVTLPGAQGEDCVRSSDRMECSAVHVLNAVEPMSATHGQEDEMLSWLRYPLEDSLDRSFCSNIFGELINPHIQLVKDVYLHQSMKDSGISHVPGTKGNDGSDVCYQEIKPAAGGIGSGMKSDTAMALGAGRAAGLLSQIGSEAFSGVRTHLTPCGMHRQSLLPSIASASNHTKAAQLAPTTSAGFNFSLFSRPLATTVDNLRVVGAASGPTNTNRARQPLAKDYELPCELYDVDSDRNLSASMPSVHQLMKVSAHGMEERVGDICQNWCSQSCLPRRQFSQSHAETAEMDSRASCVSASETAVETLEAAGTAASPSCLSGSSFEKVAQDVITTSENFVSSAQHLEPQEVEDVQANARKPPAGPRAVKRSRAAEVHNESEKKRRNKINVRLKLLQSLIPNSNKTDKASVLDEAIEYTKMLQAQVQFMSMKTGLFFPSMVHSGVQYLPMEQVSAMSHLGMGMGVPVGMNVDIGIGVPVPIPVPSSNPVNGIGEGSGTAAATCAGAGASIYTSPMVLQPLNQPGVGSQLFHKRSCSPVYDVSCSLPMACEPLRMNMTQQPLQPVLMNVHMNGDLYSASQR